jgi:hypothetical protein
MAHKGVACGNSRLTTERSLTIPTALRRRRKELDISQDELAERVGCSQTQFRMPRGMGYITAANSADYLGK